MGNPYDNPKFFQQYAQMSRSRLGLAGAGEWRQLEGLFPPVAGKRVLDLGCGYGWHCAYAAKQGAKEVLGIDQSPAMLAQAEARNRHPAVSYQVCGVEDYPYPENRWDVVASNLVLHYIERLDPVYRLVWRTLVPGGIFLFNIEHPVFTAGVGQDWIYNEAGQPRYWPVDNYFLSGPRDTRFLGCAVTKQHHTLTEILMGLLDAGFILKAVEEAKPPAEMLDMPGMKDELRRPMMLLVKAEKPQPSGEDGKPSCIK